MSVFHVLRTFFMPMRSLFGSGGRQQKYITKVDRNGAIQVVPFSKGKPAKGLTLKKFSFFLLFFSVLKVAAVLHMGAEPYDLALTKMADGTLPEKLSAAVLHIDPLTASITALF